MPLAQRRDVNLNGALDNADWNTYSTKKPCSGVKTPDTSQGYFSTESHSKQEK